MARSNSYDGGKNGSGVYQQIINLIPPHDIYVEGCLGSGAIMRLKAPARINIGWDIDKAVIDNFISRFPVNEKYQWHIENYDLFRYLELYLHGDTLKGERVFIYLDPPYLMDVRSCKKKLYKHEMDDADHIRILELISSSNVRANVMISGYDNELYNTMLPLATIPHPTSPCQGEEKKRWYKHSFSTTKRNGKKATETVWFNYPVPDRLHDYSYVGANYRERERIKLKRERWVNKLKQLAPLERNAIISAISSQYDGNQFQATSGMNVGNKDKKTWKLDKHPIVSGW